MIDQEVLFLSDQQLYLGMDPSQNFPNHNTITYLSIKSVKKVPRKLSNVLVSPSPV